MKKNRSCYQPSKENLHMKATDIFGAEILGKNEYNLSSTGTDLVIQGIILCRV
jgi:hypothetical protein